MAPPTPPPPPLDASISPPPSTTPQLPYELISYIFNLTIVSLTPHHRTRTLSSLSQVSRTWYPIARDILYLTPSLPGGNLWLLHRTFRHSPSLSHSLLSLRITSLSSPTFLLQLFATRSESNRLLLPNLTSLTLKAFKTISSGTSTTIDWEPLFLLLSQQNLSTFSWTGLDRPKQTSNLLSTTPSGLVDSFSWSGLESLSITNQRLPITHPWLRPLRPLSPPLQPSHPPSLLSLTLRDCTLPLAFFHHLSPFLPLLQTLNLHSIPNLTTETLSTSLALFASTLTTLSLLSHPRLTPSHTLFLPLKSLTSLTLDSSTTPSHLFKTLSTSSSPLRSLTLHIDSLEASLLFLQHVTSYEKSFENDEGLEKVVIKLGNRLFEKRRGFEEMERRRWWIDWEGVREVLNEWGEKRGTEVVVGRGL